MSLVISGALIRLLTDDLPTAMLVFARSLLGLLLLLPWLHRQGFTAIRTSRLSLHFMRGAVGMSAMFCLYFAWGHLPLAQAALLKQTAPFFIPVIAFFWLQEKIPYTTKVSLVLGFIGVYVVLDPTGQTIQVASLVGLLGAFLGALAKVTVRSLADTEPSVRIVFYFSLFTTLFSAIPAFMNWQTPNLEQFVLMVLMAILSTIAQLFISKAYVSTPAGILAPFTYSSVAFAALLGWIFWDDMLSYPVIIGVTIIFIACCINVIKSSKAIRS